MKALIHSKLNRDNQSTITLSTYGIVFFGTPHAGSGIASLGKHLLTILSIFASTNTSLIRHLQQNSEWLRMQTEQFNPISSEFDIITFYETDRRLIFWRKGIFVGFGFVHSNKELVQEYVSNCHMLAKKDCYT